MDKIFAFIEKFVNNIPTNVLNTIRITAILVWFVLAGVVVVYAWNYGTTSTPPSGQDLNLAEIKEQVEKEKNRKMRPEVVIPDIGELLPESETDLMPEVKEQLRKGFPRENESSEQKRHELPMITESEQLVFPSQNYEPMKDGGVGPREERDDERIGLLPLKEKKNTIPDSRSEEREDPYPVQRQATTTGVDEDENSPAEKNSTTNTEGITESLRNRVLENNRHQRGLLPVQ